MFFFKKKRGPSLTQFYSSETVSRCRPFFRRRARTFLPFLVLIRLRNPWSRFLFKFDGFRYVSDMALFSFQPFSYERVILWVNRMRVKQNFFFLTLYSQFSSLTEYKLEDIVWLDFLIFSH